MNQTVVHACWPDNTDEYLVLERISFRFNAEYVTCMENKRNVMNSVLRWLFAGPAKT
jgi:hypothetical protein